MSNKPFDRTIIRPLEKPLADDINQLETNFDQALRFFLSALFSSPSTGDAVDGFLGTGLLVAAAALPDMSVTVVPGLGFQTQVGVESAIDSVPGLNDLDTYKPIPLLANQGFTVPTAPVAPNTRIDIIEVQASRIVTDPSARQVFDEGLGQFVPSMVNKTLAWALDGRAAVVNAPSPSTAPLSYVVGQAGNPGLAPPTSPGYIKLAEIAVGSDVVAITSVDITDYRALLTEKIVKIHYPASDGFLLAGTATPQNGGYVNINAASGWIVNIGEGLEAGDVIEDVVVIAERLVGATNDIQTNLYLSDVDLDVPSVSVAIKSQSNTGIVAPLGLYEIHHKDALLPFPQPPGTYPFVWKAGSSASLEIVSDSQNDRAYSVFAIVRRATNKRDL